MAGGLSTPFDSAVVPQDVTGDFAQQKGGYDLPGGTSPVTTPFDQAITTAPGSIFETANTASGLPLQTELIQVDGAPAPGASVGAPEVYAPGIPSGAFGK